MNNQAFTKNETSLIAKLIESDIERRTRTIDREIQRSAEARTIDSKRAARFSENIDELKRQRGELRALLTKIELDQQARRREQTDRELRELYSATPEADPS